MRPTLTVGIPTYNRRETVSRRLRELIATPLPEGIEVLVIDNASPDGTYDALAEICRNTRIRLLRNERNLGFAGNFVQVIRKCETEYLLYNSDEDTPLLDNLVALQDFLRMRSPLFVSPLYRVYRDGHEWTERGKERIGEIAPADFWEGALITGQVFHAPTSKAILQDFETIQRTHPTAAGYYPQVFLGSSLLARGRCYWWPNPVNEQREQLDSQHRPDRQGFQYFQVAPRWQLHKDVMSLLREMQAAAETPAAKAAASEMLASWELKLFDFLRNGIKEEQPDLLASFDAGARRALVRDRWINRLGRLAVRFGTDPIATIRHLKRKVGRASSDAGNPAQ